MTEIRDKGWSHFKCICLHVIAKKYSTVIFLIWKCRETENSQWTTRSIFTLFSLFNCFKTSTYHGIYCGCYKHTSVSLHFNWETFSIRSPLKVSHEYHTAIAENKKYWKIISLALPLGNCFTKRFFVVTKEIKLGFSWAAITDNGF